MTTDVAINDPSLSRIDLEGMLAALQHELDGPDVSLGNLVRVQRRADEILREMRAREEVSRDAA
jgi:hypothetical protein